MPEFPDPTASAHPQGSARPNGEDAPTGDTPHAVAFLRQWAPQGPWLLSAIEPDTRHIITRTFHPDHEADATAFINCFQGKRNVYFSVNQPSHDLRIKAKKSDIAWAVALHVDIDPRAGFDLAAERVRILAALHAYQPEPSVIIDTGGGYSGFWRLLDPAPAALAADVEARNLHLAHELGGDHCHNIDRIMRLPGTLNLPDKVKQQKGRTISVARVVEADWNRCYALGDFEAADAKPAAPNGADDPDPGGPGDPSTLPDALRELIINGEPTVGHRSHVVWHVCCSLVRTGWSDAAIAAVLLDPAYRIGDHVRDQSNPAAYARKQAKKARDEVASDFDRDKRTGAIVQNDQRNIRLAVAKLGVSLSYNRFADRMLIEGPDDTPTRHLGDPEADALYLLIDEKFQFRPTRDFYRLVIDNAARRNTFHPVLDYLNGLSMGWHLANRHVAVRLRWRRRHTLHPRRRPAHAGGRRPPHQTSGLQIRRDNHAGKQPRTREVHRAEDPRRWR